MTPKKKKARVKDGGKEKSIKPKSVPLDAFRHKP